MDEYRHSRGALRLILACRSQAKGDAAKACILSAVSILREGKKVPVQGTIEIWPLNLASFESILAFAARVKNEVPHLSAFINNAGLNTNKYEAFERWESTLLVNYISTFLLGLLILPVLQQSGCKPDGKPPSLTFVGSLAHIYANENCLMQSKSILRDLNSQKTANMGERYASSKLMLLLSVRALAAELDQKTHNGDTGVPKAGSRNRVTINCVAPGWCNTGLFQTDDGGFVGRLGLRLLGRTPEAGSRTLVHAITAGPESHGKYLSECTVKLESGFVRSGEGREVQGKLWEELKEVLENVSPGVTKFV